MARLKNAIVAGMLTVVALTCLAGCHDNDGGKTSCSDFSGMDAGDQRDAVSKMISDKGASGPENNLMLTIASARLYCETHDGTATIDGIYTG